MHSIMATVPNIAFIVPAYRAADLHKPLQSLAMQTERDFSVYLADARKRCRAADGEDGSYHP